MQRLLFTLAFLFGVFGVRAQYCTPSYTATGIAAGAMGRVILSGSAAVLINDTLPASALSTGYANRSAVVGVAGIVQGRPYNVTVRYSGAAAHTGNQVWIDFNNDGFFADSEAVSIVLPASAAFFNTDSVISIAINIPLNAPVGGHKLRVRNVVYDVSTTSGMASAMLSSCNGSDIFNSYESGVTADYDVNIGSAPACTGTPVTGTIVAPASVCHSTPFTMSLLNDTIASGLSYQWFRISGSAIPISGATNRYYNAPSQPAATTYFVTVTCSSGGSVNTLPRPVGQNAFFNCYCSAALGGNPTDATIDSVAIPGTSLGNGTRNNRLPYISFPDTGMATATVVAGNTYTLLLRGGGYSRYSAAIWIDFDNSGTFDNTEHFPVTSSTVAGGLSACSFTIPLSADTGKAGLRIRTTNSLASFSSPDACIYSASGQTQDFILFISQPVSCTGVPGLSGVNTTAASACPGVPFTIFSATHHPESGINYQWYERPATGGVFTPLAGALSQAFTIPTQIRATEYMLIATCLSSGLSDSSSVRLIAQNPFYLCYCSPETGITLNNIGSAALLDSVAISGTTFSNTRSAGDTSVYHLYYPPTTATSAILQTGYPYTATVKASGTSTYNAGVWLDYNHNGSYDASEQLVVGSGISAGAVCSNILFIPPGADTGLTGMRVRAAIATGSGDGCEEQFYGTTNDYVVNIVPGPPCSGAPASGYTTATDTIVCPIDAFSVNSIAALATSGVTYQWLSRPLSGTFTAISGATTTALSITGQAATTVYALRVTCALSGLSDTSSTTTVHQDLPYLCACSPLSGVVLNDSVIAAPIDSFSILGTTLADGTVGSSAPYILLSSYGSGSLPNLNPGGNYVFTVSSAGTSAYSAAIWIDLDKNGVYDTYEFFPVTAFSQPGRPLYGSFTLPAGAASGITGLRIRTFPTGYSLSATDACAYLHLGTTHDYAVNIAAPFPCAGAPGPFLLHSTADSVCAGQAFQVFGAGITSSNGLSFQWQSAPLSTGVFATISGATNAVYNVPSQSVPTFYRFITTCSFSGLSDTTVNVLVNMNPFYLCYCSPYTGVSLHTTATLAPDSVAIAGSTLDTRTVTGPLYQQFYPLTATNSDSLSRGGTYTLHLNSHYGLYHADVWLDLNQNGVFEPTENYHAASSNAAGASSSVSIFVPYSVPTGYTGLRVRATEATFPMSGADACTPEARGSTHDYVVRIANGIPCAGMPAAGTASASVSTICAGYPFTLSDTGFTVGVGITYQWHSRPVSSGSFTSVTGATDAIFTITTQSVATEYRLTTTCAASGLSASSNIITVLQTPHYACYCAGSLGTSSSVTQFRNIQIHGSTLHLNGAFAPAHRVFGMTGDSTGVLQRTYAFPFELKVAGGSAYNAGMWIDYDHSGSFEGSEYIRLDTNAASGTTSVTTFAVPAGADTGITGVRIRTTQSANTFGRNDACTFYANSQTFDLRMRIDTLVRCSGTPEAGTISSSSPFACPSMTFNLLNEGYSVGTGYSYQWHRRTTGGYSAISGATSYTTAITGQTVTTDYVLVARCAFSGLTDTSNVLRIVENPFDSCYCAPPTGVTLVTTGGHHNILATSLFGVTTMSVPEQYPDSTGYVAVPPVPATYTTTMRRYSSYPLIVYVNYTAYTISAAAAWVDYNHNSVFDSAEYVPLTRSSDRSNWYASISIPATAQLGLTGMRIITTESGSLSASGACGPVSVGQVQDHIVNIMPAPCFSISSGTVSSITDSSARGVWGRIAGALGYQYRFDTSATPPTTGITSTADTFASSGCLLSGTRYYLHIRDSCDGGFMSGWFTISFNTLPCTGTATVTASAITNHTATVTWAAVASTMGYEYILDTSSAAPTVGGTATASTTQNFTGLTQGTTYYAHIRSGCRCSNQSAWRTISFTTICDTITHLSLVGFTDTSVTIRWDSIAGISAYSYVITTSSASPSTAGTAVSDTLITAIGLTPGTSYFAHVRHICSGGYSSWVSIPFTTSRCDTITGLTGIPNDTGIVIHWTGVAGAPAYYWVVNTIAAPPVGTLGTVTTNTRDTVGPLYSSTLYYVHVRTGCIGGSSRWVTIPVRTLDCDTATGLIVASVCDTSAILTWTASAGGYGYAYTVTTSASAPTVPGSYSAVNIAVAGGLTPGTSYYAHVRRLCSTIDSSNWISVPFSTPVCSAVTGLTATGINTTGANIAWTALTCVVGYEYTVDNVPTDPTVAGTFYATPYVAETSLSPGTTYYVHVRVVCGGGVFSGWSTYSFTTTTCPASAITVSGVSTAFATVNWSPVSAGLGYEYAIDNSMTPPAFGIYTTGISYFANALAPATTYYAHVRVLCGGGTYSSWDNEPFSTTGLSVTEVSQQPFTINAWPNPADGKVAIVVAGGKQDGLVQLTDLTGKVLLTALLKDGRAVLDVAPLASGLYIVRYSDGAHSAILKLNKQ